MTVIWLKVMLKFTMLGNTPAGIAENAVKQYLSTSTLFKVNLVCNFITACMKLSTPSHCKSQPMLKL